MFFLCPFHSVRPMTAQPLPVYPGSGNLGRGTHSARCMFLCGPQAKNGFYFLFCYYLVFSCFLIEVELIYNIVLVLVKYIWFFRFFSITGYYKILNIVPCTVQ